jgi:hypothetical protein
MGDLTSRIFLCETGGANAPANEVPELSNLSLSRLQA